MAEDQGYQKAVDTIAALRASGGRALSLSFLRLRALPPELAELTDLESLDLRGNGLTTLPEWLGQLTGLQRLDLRGNGLTTLPEGMGQLTGLQRLHLGGNGLTTLPEWLGQLTGLQWLDLGGNGLATLPEWLGQLTGLHRLHLSGNGLTTLPEGLGQLTGLHRLDLSGNGLTTLPEWLGQLTGLQTLDLRRNGLTTLPEWLGQLTGLQRLHLGGNGLITLPEGLGQLTGLQWLDLGGNGLTTLPEGLGQLTGLYRLDLSGNGLTTLPEWLGQLTGLQTLDLGGNGLITLPEWLGQLTGLQWLDLSGNGLTTLPKGLGQLTDLQWLDLGGNGLTTLPEWLGQLTDLQWLDLGGNGLTTLPEWLGQLTDLQWLDLSGNGLTTLPDWLGQLTSLEVGAQSFSDFGLALNSNPLPFPYPTLIAPGQPKATINVLAWLRGELDPATLTDSQLVEDEDERPDNLAQITEQRPAAYRFGLRGGRIDVLPEQAEPADPEVAADLLGELLDKIRDLHGRLATANAAPRVLGSVERLRDALSGPMGALRPGILLSRSRSIEADRDAFDTPEGRAELFPDAIARMNDVLLSLRDLLAVYPAIRGIEVERLALDIQRKPENLPAIAAAADAFVEAARPSEALTPAVAASLTFNDRAITEAGTSEVKVALVADKLLVEANLVRVAVQVAPAVLHAEAEAVGSAPPTVSGEKQGRIRAELGELGERSWNEIKDNLPLGIGGVSRVLPIAVLATLMAAIAGPVGVLASLIPLFRTLSGAIKSSRTLKAKAEPSPIPKTSSAAPKAPSPRRTRIAKKGKKT